MRKLADVLFAPDHLVLLLPPVYLLIALQAADIAGLMTPNYAYLGGLITLSYFGSICIEARAQRRS